MLQLGRTRIPQGARNTAAVIAIGSRGFLDDTTEQVRPVQQLSVLYFAAASPSFFAQMQSDTGEAIGHRTMGNRKIQGQYIVMLKAFIPERQARPGLIRSIGGAAMDKPLVTDKNRSGLEQHALSRRQGADFV